MSKIIAFYLPQFHPIPENNAWWGEGFTEWTNVGKAKPLFKGHYQPRVPADLGYYDLRLPESRIAQAKMAKEYGVDGFCYWHYWFGNGKRLIEKPFEEVLHSGEPDFPFCLGWANHSWEDKQFNAEGTSKLLIEQKYPGKEDYILHFNSLLKAFKDPRYIQIENKPVFYIHSPYRIPDIQVLFQTWQELAKENGLKGIHFVANTYNMEDIEVFLQMGFDAVNTVRMFHIFKKENDFLSALKSKIGKLLLKKGQVVDYAKAAKFFSGKEDESEHVYPSIFPNWDHSPRSGRGGHILHNSTPAKFKKHVKEVLRLTKKKNPPHQVIFLRSWNEWAEGNYMEPDLRFGKQYLEALKEARSEENF
ncbi:lipopolysaccharide biosynthesis protein [Sandaracinomonas limnophila]|uniref:Lipopolysaccharide biosynthesis protein n=1 Tax=Sandaracinomonas limnophila TaxID=1862386 RepID=A0A437PTG3_9BACT|nr:glycoside hydrolase family 99-like domain-containing protein [Sandaracinomonas limnophila]RVU25538.1 lipopolysaccharide biosynthesis protein [Sandaracinomonas limnophila]